LLRNTGLRHQVSIANANETAGSRQPQLQLQPQSQSQYKRFHIMMTHGFRKFFETNAFKAGMDHMYLRRLMGQQSGLEDAYLKLSEEELLEGDNKHAGYVDIIDQLTIDESSKLRREVATLRIEKNNWDIMRKELDEIKEVLNRP
jgi:hypothetical protein